MRSTPVGRIWACLTLLAIPAAAQEAISVRDVMSFSFASGLVAAPSGDRIAWIENREGERNIWVAEGPDWAGRRLTTYSGDDGQELSGLAFSPDGEQVFWVRGGAPNRQGEVPDPLFTPDEEGRAVWVSQFSGSEPIHVIDGGSFTVSPEGRQIAYGRGRDLFLRPVDRGGEPQRVAQRIGHRLGRDESGQAGQSNDTDSGRHDNLS